MKNEPKNQTAIVDGVWPRCVENNIPEIHSHLTGSFWGESVIVTTLQSLLAEYNLRADEQKT